MGYFGISGVPTPIQYAGTVAAYAPGRSAAALDRGVDWVRSELQRRAAEHPEWKDVAHGLDVVLDPRSGVFTVTFSDEVAQQATDLEFGNPDDPPSPFLRQTLKALEAEAGKRLNRELSY